MAGHISLFLFLTNNHMFNIFCEKLHVRSGKGCACTVELYLAKYSRMEESLLQGMHMSSVLWPGGTYEVE
jgi:hypothetical protein